MEFDQPSPPKLVTDIFVDASHKLDSLMYMEFRGFVADMETVASESSNPDSRKSLELRLSNCFYEEDNYRTIPRRVTIAGPAYAEKNVTVATELPRMSLHGSSTLCHGIVFIDKADRFDRHAEAAFHIQD